METEGKLMGRIEKGTTVDLPVADVLATQLAVVVAVTVTDCNAATVVAAVVKVFPVALWVAPFIVH
jgi:hypothetical protein